MKPAPIVRLSFRVVRVWVPVLAVLPSLSGCLGRSRAAELYPEVAEHQNKEITELRFVGGEPFSADSLQTLIDSQPTHCNLLGLPICVPFIGLGRQVHRLNVETVRRDLARLAAFYRREGYFGTRVIPRAEPADGDAEHIVLTLVIRRGDPIVLDSLTVEGVEGIFSADSIARELPSTPGERFDLGEFELSADQVLRALQSRGYAHAELLRNFFVDTLADRAVASLTAVPGVQVQVDSIIVVGADHLGRGGTLRQLTLRPGELLRLPALVESQTNLYGLEIVQLASVVIAPDSLQKTPSDASTATILVSVAEGPPNQAEAAVGYGDVECFRTEGSWTNRSFMGGARRLNVTGSLSKIGLGDFTDAGLGGSLCRAFRADTFQHTLDYRLASEFTQPFFLTPRNHLTLNLHAERVSEPRTFQRQAVGGGARVNRRLAPRTFLAASVDIERAKTLASPAQFCTAFQVCAPQDLEHIGLPRYRNTLGLNVVRDRTDNPLNATRGYVVRSGIAWATPWLSSTITFTRWTGEAAFYRVVKPGWVFATSVRLGNYFQSATLDPARGRDDFLPPEERFYAGGATTVRGFDRNSLGPGVYTTRDTVRGEDGLLRPKDDTYTFVPLGGTSLRVVNAEVRFPSPVMRRRLRLAAFVDAGAINSGQLWEMGAGDWYFTPGVGFRISTPVGPARVDVAYNPYRQVRGLLFHVTADSIRTIRDDFTPPAPGFFGRMRLHIAIGQAF